MADYLHRTTKEHLKSVSTDPTVYPSANWIKNPDMSSVSGVASKYWVITGDVVSEADQSTKDTIDADELAQTQTDCKAEIDTKYTAVTRHANSTQRDTAKTDVDAANTVASAVAAANAYKRG